MARGMPSATAARGPRPVEPRKPGISGGPDPPAGQSFTFIVTDDLGPPGGYGIWRLSTRIPGQRDLIIRISPIATGDCDHRWQANGHDPGVMLRHLTQVRYATCTGPGCRRPSTRADFDTTSPTRPAAAPVRAMGIRSAGTITG